MHVLVIPSEEFLPEHDPGAGIFQQHQMDALSRQTSIRTGFLSVRLRYSPLMITRSLLFRLVSRTTGNALDERSVSDLFSMAYQQFFKKQEVVKTTTRAGFEGATVESFYLPSPSIYTDWYAWIRGGLLAFDQYCKTFGTPDVIHAHNALYGGLLAERLHRKSGIPYLVTEHSSFFKQGLIPRYLKSRAASCYSNASVTMAVSESLKESLIDLVSEDCRRMQVVPNVLDPLLEDTELVSPRRNRENTVRLLAIGNLLPVKGHQYLLRALPSLEKRLPQHTFSLRIGGDGELRQTLRQMAESMQTETTVTFLGQLSRKEVISEIQDCDLMILPSLTETFGVVVIEALALGRPVVATRCGGPDKIINNQNGLLVDPGDTEKLAEAIALAITKIESFDAKAIRDSCLDQYGNGAFSRTMNDLYTIALNRN